jgi:hypothetical protein
MLANMRTGVSVNMSFSICFPAGTVVVISLRGFWSFIVCGF